MILKTMFGKRLCNLVLICALALGLLAPVPLRAEEAGSFYANPVTNGSADAFPDPSIIRAKDGYWYAYGTSTRMLKSTPGANHRMPISRSKDLTHWEFVGDVFNTSNRPAWLPVSAQNYWAPDVRYVDGMYYLYYSMINNSKTGYEHYLIGLATAPTPAGPWTDSGGPVVNPSKDTVTIDPALFIDQDGSRYLYYGSFDKKGIQVTRLTSDSKQAVGDPVKVVGGNTGEAPYVVKHGPYYYLFYSDHGCCANTLSSYTIFVGRSTHPMGPFLDREGVSLAESRVGGTIVNATNGNKWIGTGHNAITTDLSGQEWIFFNGINKDDAPNAGYRPMMMDRLDWIDGWPVVNAGAYTSEESRPGPVTSWKAGSDFNGITEIAGEWSREGAAGDGWQVIQQGEGEAYIQQHAPAAKASYLVNSGQLPADVRAEADVRLISHPKDDGRAGLTAGYRDEANHITAWLDAGSKALVTEVTVGGKVAAHAETPLLECFRFDTWHNIAMEIRGSALSVTLTEARLGEPIAAQQLELPAEAAGQGRVGIASRSTRAEADNVGAAPLYILVKDRVPEPAVGALDSAYSDEFNNVTMDPAWSWVRTPGGTVTDGVYRWPTQNGGEIRKKVPSVLLREAPQGDYTVETKMELPLGTDTIRNFQQAGLIAYDNDNLSIRLISMAFWDVRQIKFAKEVDGIGTMRIGPSADELWLRMSHHVDPNNGEHEFRAASSRDGNSWIWGGVWTLPASANPRIGLVSMGGTGGVAEFDYFRVYR